jgi:glucose/arabinose dehydrogenase
MARAHATLLAGLLLVPLLAACGDDEPAELPPTVPPTTSAAPATSAAAGPTEAPPVSVARTVAANLELPWGVAFLPGGGALVAERDTAKVLRVAEDGGTSEAGTVAGVVPNGEGGLLGLAIPPSSGGGTTVYAYFTAADDNRIVSMPYEDGRLGRPTTVLTGIPNAGNHNGGRMLFGPDGKLWIGTGEAGDPPLAQDLKSLGGKILRVNPDGSVPADNPFRGSPVWSLGHRNVQGLAFDSRDRLWATEFGQNDWDELNLVERGKNYGWPVIGFGVMYRTGAIIHAATIREGMEQPVHVWVPSIAVSGLMQYRGTAFSGWRNNIFAGGLGGEQVVRLTLDGKKVLNAEQLVQRRGRIRDVRQGPDGFVYVAFESRDGTPTSIVRLEPASGS